MEYEDSRNALFVEPNAYVQRPVEVQSKKIIFREPYENLPRYRPQTESSKKIEQSTVCEQPPRSNLPPFNLKNIMPLVGSFMGGGENNILSALTSNSGFDISKILSLFTENKSSMSSILNLFTGKNSNKNNTNNVPKETDFEIKNYTKVE